MTINSTMASEAIPAVVATNSTADIKSNGDVASNKPEAGMECDIKNLYQGKEDSRGRFTWTEKFPEDLEEAAENELTAAYAILIRHRKCFSDSRKALEIDSIVVQSPLLKKVLGVVLAGYPGMFH